MNFEIQEHDIMKKRPIVPFFFILILVLVEDGLWPEEFSAIGIANSES